MRLVLPERAVPGVTVEIGPVALVRSALPPARAIATVDGWPLVLVRAAGAVHAHYRFDGYGAEVVARGAVEEHEVELTALFVAGRPDFRGGGVVALADAFEEAP